MRIQPEALDALHKLAEAEGVSPVEYLDALLNYAWSGMRRPGSWEANCAFEYRNYDRRPRPDNSLAGCADRWWTRPPATRRRVRA